LELLCFVELVLRIDRAVDMVGDAKFSKGDFEEGAPHVVVVLGEVENDRTVGMNVDVLDNGCGDGVGRSISKGIGGGRARLRRWDSTP
jgi:hypothetical protein